MPIVLTPDPSGLLTSYATLADLRARLLSGGSLATTDDPILTDALDSASRSIEGATNRQFNLDTGLTSRVFYPISSNVALVDDMSSVAGLVIKTDNDDDGIFETTWAAADYLLRPLNGIAHGVPGWAYERIDAVGVNYFPVAGRNAFAGSISGEYFNSTAPLIRKRPSLQVTATFGWPSVPANIRQACLLLAEEIYKLKDAPQAILGLGNPAVAELLEDYSEGQVIFA